jgi:phospholipase C
MMENRSFDHLSGYLKLEAGKPVDGLTAGMFNQYKNKKYVVHRLTDTAFDDGQDPCHSGQCVAEQIRGANGGFVANYARTHPADPDPGLVMGYYNADSVPVYDHLASGFCVCDRWFCSVDGATWPNRLYSLTGRAANSKDNRIVPLYDIPSVMRNLDRLNVSWNWYSHDISTLRLVDSRYRVGHLDRFHDFEHHSKPNFLRHAATGQLASVSWIDPDFGDFGFSGNDDHPPADLKAGQELILKLVHAVTSGPQWLKTLLVIIYDEHGGLYDHVTPLKADDDAPAFRRYGPRVPAFVVSPWVEPGGVASQIFDHTSILKTILLKFCKNAAGAIPNMGRRVTAANHLGGLLSRTTVAPPVDLSPLIELAANWKKDQFIEAFARSRETAEVSMQHVPANDFQEGLARARKELTRRGLPEAAR